MDTEEAEIRRLLDEWNRGLAVKDLENFKTMFGQISDLLSTRPPIC